jgi:signal transduction histidine kinase
MMVEPSLMNAIRRWLKNTFSPDYQFYAGVQQIQTLLQEKLDKTALEHLFTQEIPHLLQAEWGYFARTSSTHLPNYVYQNQVITIPIIHAGSLIGHYWLGPRRCGAFSRSEQQQIIALLHQAGAALYHFENIDEQRTTNTQLQQEKALQAVQLHQLRQTLAAIEDHQSNSREFYDRLTQTLFGLKLGLRTVRSMFGSDTLPIQSALLKHELLADQALIDVRDLLVQMRAPLTAATNLAAFPIPPDDHVDLVAILQQQCPRFTEQNKLNITLNLPTVLIVPHQLATELLAVIHEAFQNTLKHSGVSSVYCSLQLEADELVLVLADGGRGFDLDRVNRFAYGLRAMREHIRSLDGLFEVASAPGQGTVFQIRVPLLSLERAVGATTPV